MSVSAGEPATDITVVIPELGGGRRHGAVEPATAWRWVWGAFVVLWPMVALGVGACVRHVRR